ALLLADQTLFRRAVANLVSNAIRHTAPGGEVAASACQLADGSVQVSVKDSGCGIDPEHLPRLFDRFYQVSGAASSRAGAGTGEERGCGLGLAIVKAIMTMHGGTVTIASRPGQGTTVLLGFAAPRDR